MRTWFTEAHLVAMVGEDGVARASAFDVRLTGAEGSLLGECDLCGEEFNEHCSTAAWHTLDLVALPESAIRWRGRNPSTGTRS